MLIMLCQHMWARFIKKLLLAWLNFYICSEQHLCICICIGITMKYTFICQPRAGINILGNKLKKTRKFCELVRFHGKTIKRRFFGRKMKERRSAPCVSLLSFILRLGKCCFIVLPWILGNTATSTLECRAGLMARFGCIVCENYAALTFP